MNRSVVLLEPGRLSLREVPEPDPAPDEAVVRVRRVGVCGTDWHALAGRHPAVTYPRVLGHELAVVVEHLPAGTDDVRVGDICAVRPYVDDVASRASLRGRPNCCESLRVLGVHVDGGMCDRLAVRADLLLPANDLPLDAVALVEPLAIGCHAVARAHVDATDDVLVIGAGPIGAAVAQFALPDAASVTLVDVSPARLTRAEAILPGSNLQVSSSFPAARRFDVVFDATGSAASMTRAFDAVGAGGRLVFVGVTRESLTFDAAEFHRREVTLLASRNATHDDFARVLAAVRSAEAQPQRWVTHRLTLDDVPSSFLRLQQEPSLFKAVVEID